MASSTRLGLILWSAALGFAMMRPAQAQTIPSIYGNGSAGAFIAPDGTSTFAERNVQFTDFTVPAGAWLDVPSGAVIRATGTVNIQGRLVVGPFASRGSVVDGLAPHPGIGGQAAGNYQTGTTGQALRGGSGGYGLTADRARFQVVFGPAGGGGGGGFGGGIQGGGTVRILARNSINIDPNEFILANGWDGSGTPGGGGGGGGVVVLAAGTSITLAGRINARGGAGAPASSTAGSAAGGGGGGGLVHLLAPIINNTGTIDVAGGAAGSHLPSLPGTSRRSGAGGGGSAGAGGKGGDIQASGAPAPGVAGFVGFMAQTLTDPAAFFM